ncbi:hypothetical protein [Carboxylicivirga sp. N1Y90]|uniref:hypothetical protein n=1 Tax=Carboxylicivirga fragile TaxID=3417571 RepID=UPI003D358F0F|nr:hypothetical protein [Marinilabiliaceae bacterium N1Y90]
MNVLYNYADGTTLVDYDNVYTRYRLLYEGMKLTLVIDEEVTMVEITHIHDDLDYVYFEAKELVKGNPNLCYS